MTKLKQKRINKKKRQKVKQKKRLKEPPIWASARQADGPPDRKPSHRRTAGMLLAVCFRRERGALKGAKLRSYPGPCPSSSHHQWRDRWDPARGGVGEAVEGMDPVRGAGSDEGISAWA